MRLYPCQLAVRQAGDWLAFLVADRVTAGGQNDTGSSTVRELDFRVRQRAVGAGQHDLEQVALEQGQHHLGLRVAIAAVVLNDLGAVRGEHEAEVEAALKGAALGVHGMDGGQEDLLHALGGVC